MKTLRLFLFLAFNLSLTIFYSCDTNIFTGCENDYDLVVHNSLTCVILDKDSYENIFHIRSNRYHYDSIALYDKLNPKIESQNYLFIGQDGKLSIHFIDDDEEGVFNQRIEKRFFFYFNHEDQDTIDMEYEFSKNDCKHQEISYFKIAYNDSIYFDSPINYVPNIQFLK